MIILIKKKAETVYKNITIIKINKAMLAKSTYHQLNINSLLFQLNLVHKNFLHIYFNKIMFLNSNKIKRMKLQILINNQYLIE